MAMQSGIVYGRLIFGQARQIVRSFVAKGLTPTQSFGLVTAYCGFAKLNSNQPKKKFLYGEDSFFIAENKFANVLGAYSVLSSFSIHFKCRWRVGQKRFEKGGKNHVTSV